MVQTWSLNLATAPLALLAECRASGLSLQGTSPLSAGLVVWEAGDRAAGSLNEAQSAALTEHVRTGGRLLFTLQASPGLAAVRLGNILPSTGCATQQRPSSLTPRQPLGIAQTDPTYCVEGFAGLVTPHCWDIRPTPAVERGQARYERYQFSNPWLHTDVPAGSDFWSRSLLNREWTVRARCNDLAQLPLVVTGRYGAGKVAMVATSAAGIGESRSFWSRTLRWLLTEDEDGPSRSVAPKLVTLFAGAEARVTVSNPGSTPLRLQMVVRALSVDGAVLADGTGEMQRKVVVAAGQALTVAWPLPGQGPLRLRVGALSGDGSTVLAEQRVVSPASPDDSLQLLIHTDNLYSLPYPFHAPGPDALAAFRGRMGTFTNAYAYAPGQVLRGSLVLSNGVVNLAPGARMEDVTTPGNASVMALNDEASSVGQVPNTDKIAGYSLWMGKAGMENVLRCTLAEEAEISAVVLLGSFRPAYGMHNPGRVVIEADGQPVGSLNDLDTAFAAGYGQARIAFPACRARTVTVRFPWLASLGSGSGGRQAPWLGELKVEGFAGKAGAAVAGRLAVSLVDALSGRRVAILDTAVTVAGRAGWRQSFAATCPAGPGIQFYRLEASFEHVTASVPVLVLSPAKALRPLTDLRPDNALSVGLNVSQGFREVFSLGTGTAEPTQGWSSPDDLIWSYSRQLKQISRRAHTAANRLYLSASDMRHYITPWCSFSNGELFFPAAAGALVAQLARDGRWGHSDTVQLVFADRWDSGPDPANLQGWQDYVAFDEFLREGGGGGLSGRTHEEVAAEIDSRFPSQWQAWQLERYTRGVRSLRDAFAAAGKSLVISAQMVPMVAGEAGRSLALSLRGLHDDFTWSMLEESPVLTTGRQLSELAFNPVWEMADLAPWGYNSALLNNWQWHTPVGTTEPSRRHLYDRAWRATWWPGKGYGSVYTYGYASNAGVAYTMNEEDFQQWWYLQERHSLLSPEAPLGAGLVISSAQASDGADVRFTCSDPLSLEGPRALALAFRRLHDAGVSVAFAANADSLGDYRLGAPLILLNLGAFSAAEVAMVTQLHQRGTRLAAFALRGELSPAAAALFRLPGTVLIERSPADLSHQEALAVAAQLHVALELPLRFAEGTAGYGFRSQDTTFVVMEDWLEQARMVAVEVARSSGAVTAVACDVNAHRGLTVRSREGWWVIDAPLGSGDGMLIALKEEMRGS